MYRICVGNMEFYESGSSFCIGNLDTIVNPVPHSDFSDPVFGSVIYDSGTGEDFSVLIFLEGTDSLFSYPDPRY